MADGDPFTDPAGFDQPDERADEFFKWLATAPATFFGTLDDAIKHQNSAPAAATPRHWISIGPRNVGGAVRAIAQNPSNPNVFYAGSAQGGLWTSTDNGYSWQPVDGVPSGVPVGTIAIAPSKPDVLYVGTGEPIIYLVNGGASHQVSGNGIYRSVGGAPFSQLVGTGAGVAGAATNYTKIIVDPNEPQRIWAASERGLWRRDPTAGGGAFTLEALPLPAGASPLVTDVALTVDPAHPNTYVLLAGVFGVGIFRAVFTRPSTMGAWTAINGPWAGGIGRVRVVFSGTKADVNSGRPFGYAVMEDRGTTKRNVTGYPTPVYQSSDLGLTWPQRDNARPFEPPASGAKTGNGWYALVLAVDPDDPLRLIGGFVNLHQSGDGGLNFAPPSVDSAPILDWRLYDQGDRAQHGDIHAILFDSRESCRLWVGSDGGISYTDDFLAAYPPPLVPGQFGPPPTPKPRWRKRSYGIVAAQFTGFTSHPKYPFMCGGGMQDNGSFVSYGGPTWYRLFGADGGELGMDANDPRHFYPSWQAAIEEVQVQSANKPPYPQNSSPLPDVDPPDNVMAPVVKQALNFPDQNAALWIGVIAFDPATSNRMVIGRDKAKSQTGGFYTSDGVTMTPLNTPGINSQVTAAAFAPNSGDIWIGTAGTSTASAQVYLVNAPAPNAPGVWNLVTLPAPAGVIIDRIAAIAVHPQNSNVVAIATMGRGDVFLSHDHGAHWVTIRGGAAMNLPPGPIPCVAWDPSNTQVLFAGTLAGVYTTVDLPGRPAGSADLTAGAAITPTWRTYNLGLPIILVSEFSVTANGTLRAATFGRGIYESDLPATAAGFQIPAVRLSIRDSVIDDSRAYAAAATFNDDPRLPAAAHPLDHTHAYDIRIDAPGFVRSEAFDFGEDIDGVEFDETLVCDSPIAGLTNRVYVQVHNRGWDLANGVVLNVYFAEAGNPVSIPNIDAQLGFPGLPVAGSAWRLIESRTLPQPVRSGRPSVERFDWVPPVDLKDNVVLMAICTHNSDQLPTPVPSGKAEDFVTGERRAGLRVVSVVRNPINIRDSADDDGRVGSVAWGGRSPDIVVTQVAVANPNDPNGSLADLADRRETDVVKTGANHIYVRLSNRLQITVKAKVRVYSMPTATPVPGSGWTQIGEVQVDDVPPLGWKFGAIDWNGVTDPAPAKGFALIAVANMLDNTGTVVQDFPDPATVTDIDSLWHFLTDSVGARASAMRALHFQA